MSIADLNSKREQLSDALEKLRGLEFTKIKKAGARDAIIVRDAVLKFEKIKKERGVKDALSYLKQHINELRRSDK